MSASLDDSQVQSAAAYNRDRPYTGGLWKQIQKELGVAEDGKPGPDTAQAAANYQAAHGLSADGKVGPGTLAALRLGRIFTLNGSGPFFFLGQLAIDADGAPNAYNKADTGIDYLANAGPTSSGHWPGLATKGGEPCVQDASDPMPGYYVSTTALCEPGQSAYSPLCYVDSTAISYISLPGNISDLGLTGGVRKGDLAAVLLISNPGRIVYAIYADVGPRCRLDPKSNQDLGEGSVRLAQELGHDPYGSTTPRRADNGIDSGVFFLVFPGSGAGRPLSAEEIQARGERAFQAWGGTPALATALKKLGVAPHDAGGAADSVESQACPGS